MVHCPLESCCQPSAQGWVNGSGVWSTTHILFHQTSLPLPAGAGAVAIRLIDRVTRRQRHQGYRGHDGDDRKGC